MSLSHHRSIGPWIYRPRLQCHTSRVPLAADLTGPLPIVVSSSLEQQPHSLNNFFQLILSPVSPTQNSLKKNKSCLLLLLETLHHARDSLDTRFQMAPPSHRDFILNSGPLVVLALLAHTPATKSRNSANEQTETKRQPTSASCFLSFCLALGITWLPMHLAYVLDRDEESRQPAGTSPLVPAFCPGQTASFYPGRT